VLVTRAAKSKRIELESIILAHSLAQQTARAKRSSAESSPANRAPSISRQSASGSRCALFCVSSPHAVIDPNSVYPRAIVEQATGRVPPHSPAELPRLALPNHPRSG
jgi:hypothetical protein